MATTNEEKNNKLIHIDSRKCLEKSLQKYPISATHLVDIGPTDVKVLNASTNNTLHITSTRSSSVASLNTNPTTANNQHHSTKTVHFASYIGIADTAATGHYVTPNCHVTNYSKKSYGRNEEVKAV